MSRASDGIPSPGRRGVPHVQRPQVVGDLPERRAVAGGVEAHRRQVRRPCSFARPGVYQRERITAVLVRRRDNGRWEPPGGVLELEETFHEGLRREVREETGLEVEPGRLTGVYKNMARGIVTLVFRWRVTGGRLVETAEADAFRWAAADEPDGLMDEVFAIRIPDALCEGAEPAVREHDGGRVL